MPSRLTPSVGWVWAALVAATIVVPGRSVHAQALEPRSYANTPVGINFLLLGYGYTEGDVAFDASSPIKDAKVHVHAGLLAYARSLDVWGLSGKFVACCPLPRCRAVQSLRARNGSARYSASTIAPTTTSGPSGSSGNTAGVEGCSELREEGQRSNRASD